MPRRAGHWPVRMLARVGGAEGTGGVGLDEAHAAGGEAVDIWRFADGAAEEARIAPAEVVGEDKDDLYRAARHRWGFRRVIVMPSWSWPGRSAQARL